MIPENDYETRVRLLLDYLGELRKQQELFFDESVSRTIKRVINELNTLLIESDDNAND